MRPSVSALASAALVLIAAGTVAERARSQNQAKLDDATILAIIEFAHTAELETGQLAQEKGGVEEVKDLARNFVAAHTQGRNEGRALGRNLNLNPRLAENDPMARSHSQAITRLRGLTGKTFDKTYLDHEVFFHQSLLDKTRAELIPAAASAEVKAYLNKIAPMIQAHLEEAKALQGRVVAAEN